MNGIIEGAGKAISLIVSLDREVFTIAALSLQVTVGATFIAALVGMPIGVAVALNSFPGKRIVVTIMNTLLALPTVLIGLMAYSFLSRSGPFGMLGLLYSPGAIVIGDIILATPIIAALTLSATTSVDPRVRSTAASLGANGFQSAIKVMAEAKFALLAAVIAGVGRVITEVGSAMMLGGNIEGYSRTLTTAIVLETGKGDFALAIALGFVLLILALVINAVLHYVQQHD